MSERVASDAAQLVARQIDAYNAHDAAAFAAAYAENMQLFDLGGELFLYGR
ncbi:MAG: steroid delta-isomerase, partial [Candidatus Eremiobacteraeota bacterium]|nr:steroid delta-isomerase [Candidatus Eremiobacteraeota bacterium]